MTDTAIEIVTSAVVERLDRVAFHFEERMNTRELRGLLGQNLSESAKKRFQDRCCNEEIYLLYELVHLLDYVKRLFATTKKDMKVLSDIEANDDYKYAANFVNSHKHGPRGRNQKSAYVSCYIEAVDSRSNSVIDVSPVINYDGKLVVALDLSKKLIGMWISFLARNTEIELSTFRQRILDALKLPEGMSLYVADVPMEGLERWAKQEAEKRKHLDIK